MHPHRSNALDGAAAALTVALRRGVAVECAVTVMVLVSSSSGPRVSGCPRAHGETLGFGPHRVKPYKSKHAHWYKAVWIFPSADRRRPPSPRVYDQGIYGVTYSFFVVRTPRRVSVRSMLKRPLGILPWST